MSKKRQYSWKDLEEFARKTIKPIYFEPVEWASNQFEHQSPASSWGNNYLVQIKNKSKPILVYRGTRNIFCENNFDWSCFIFERIK